MSAMQITLRFRLRDKHSSDLNRQACAVNYVWNYANETQQKAVRDNGEWLSWVALQRLTAGSSEMLNLSSRTINRVCAQYDQSRRQQRKPWLRWRGRHSLGWVPFNTNDLWFDGRHFRFRRVRYEPMKLHHMLQPGMRFGAGSFNADAKGHWYLNVPIEVDCADQDYSGAVGIDLGLTTMATLSDGVTVDMPRFYRQSEAALAVAQRARKSKRARAIHAKARNRRKDFLHKASLTLAKEYGTIILGDVAPSKLAKTRMAKSVHDAGWAGFKEMISYKAMMHGGRMIEVSEAMTTQVCSECGSLPASRPKGIADLGIREWCCGGCGAVHNRDVNAARNILRVGLDTLVEGARIRAGAAKSGVSAELVSPTTNPRR